MALSVFDDQLSYPQQQKLNEVLGTATKAWDELKHHMVSHFSTISEEWVFSGENYGWSLRLRHNKRSILYMTPCDGCFKVGFALGKKAVNAALKSDLPDTIYSLIKESPKYAEGRGVRITVNNLEDVKTVVKIAELKMTH